MSHWYSNLGFNRNLLVQLSGGPIRYQLDVYVIARFQFIHSEDTPNWTSSDEDSWKRQFANLVYSTWSQKWPLISATSCDRSDNSESSGHLPRARIRVHAVDVDHPSIRLPLTQRAYRINVYRQASNAPRARQHADGLATSGGTVRDAARSGLPSGTGTAELYEDSLELGEPSTVDGNRQVTAMHEFGHMLGLMHPNDMEIGCSQDRSARICYGQPYSPQSGSIMGRGQEVRREDYGVFPGIMSRLVREYSSSWYSSSRLYWMVEGSADRWCEGNFGNFGVAPRHTGPAAASRRYAQAPGTVGGRNSQGNGRVPGPLGVG